MGDNEYSDSIEQFKKPVQQIQNPNLLGSQFGGVDPRSVGMQQQQQQQQPQQISAEQFKIQQQQQMMAQQQMLRQQALQQQALQQPIEQNNISNKINNMKEKFENVNIYKLLQESIILIVLFLIYNNELFKNLVANLPIINTSGGNYDTLSGIIIAVVFSIIFILIRMLI
jgi:hypothetical protein